jgi:predicted Zn-dependent protease
VIVTAAVLVAAFSQLLAENQAPSSASPASDAASIRSLFEKGAWGEGLAALKRIPEREEEATDLTLLRAAVALETADYRNAFRLYRRLLDRFPGDAGLMNNLAWTRVRASDPAIRDLDQALDEARDALFQRPSDPNIWNTLAEVYQARGETERALRLAILARDLARAAGVKDLRIFDETVRRCGEQRQTAVR